MKSYSSIPTMKHKYTIIKKKNIMTTSKKIKPSKISKNIKLLYERVKTKNNKYKTTCNLTKLTSLKEIL